ncbi:MAG: hypothetical protein M1820_010446 [Bogoriella megaspora]|nr:MAG: hypothetical protein M1820_010446 [Bogoriella megaspora]
MIAIYAIGFTILLLIWYLIHVNNGFYQVPGEVRELAAPEWTEVEIRKTYQNVCENPIDFTPHLPPALKRRYVIVGGSGLVGGNIALHLLARGQTPESIRIIDFRKPVRSDLLQREAPEVEFVSADITSFDSVDAAFQRPWAPNVASLPLTVFHTAALIRPGERVKSLLYRVWSVNVDGTKNVMAVAKRVGADVFIATSSGSISIRPVNYWIPPWKKTADNNLQIYKDPDKDQTIRPHGNYFCNYSESKAHAEDLVLKANDGSFQTGTIRPACGIYGSKNDVVIGFLLTRKSVETWIAHCMQSSVHVGHVSLAHLLYERALVHPPSSLKGTSVGGRPFTITDPNPPPFAGSVYRLISVLTGARVTHLPPVLIFVMAHVMELYVLFVFYFPKVAKLCGLKEPQGLTANLQPAILTTCGAQQFATSTQIEKSVEDGGLGFRGVCTTLEGMCDQVRRFKEAEGLEALGRNGAALAVPMKK